MGVILRLAWRNIWRQPHRTFLTLGAVALTCAVLVFFIALQLSSYATSVEAATSIFQGHMQIQKNGYLDRPQMRLSLDDPKSLNTIASSFQEIKAVSPRAFGFALASSENRSYGVQVVGVDPAGESLVSTIPKLIYNGRYLQSDSEYAAVIGDTLAQNLKISLGDDLTLLGQGKDGSLAATVIPVVGLFNSGSPEIDQAMIHLPLKTFQEEFSMGTSVHSMVLKLDHIDSIAVIEPKLQQQLDEIESSNGSLEALRWDELLPGVKEGIELDYASSWLFYLSLVLIVCFTILNTFLMSVLERTQEFGLMLALGATPKKISLMVFSESMLLTFFGLLLGLAIGGLITIYFGIYGFAVPGSEKIMELWSLPVALYPKLNAASLLTGPLVIVFTTLIAITYPLIKILKIQAVDAMRAV